MEKLLCPHLIDQCWSNDDAIDWSEPSDRSSEIASMRKLRKYLTDEDKELYSILFIKNKTQVEAAEILDLIQIPATLCKQTFLIFAAADSGKPINIKKGTFVIPYDMQYIVEKITSRGNDQIILTERGTDFGYSDTVVDFRSIEIMQSLGYPVIFDASHSVRVMSKRSDDPEGATPEFIPLLTRCAAAAGAD